MLVVMSGCAKFPYDSSHSMSKILVNKAINTPTSPIVTAFEKVCINNASSVDGMIKAAKAFNVGEINTSTYKYKGSEITKTSMKTIDNKIFFNIYEPKIKCTVYSDSGKNVVVDALFGPNYNQEQQIMDLQLGRILFEKYGTSIIITKIVKTISGNTTHYGPSYARFDGEKLMRYFIMPYGSNVLITLTDEAK